MGSDSLVLLVGIKHKKMDCPPQKEMKKAKCIEKKDVQKCC